MEQMEYESTVGTSAIGMQDSNTYPSITEACVDPGINISSLPLIEIIQTHCLVSNSEKSKILVLICYNETDAFGEVICNWLINSTPIANLLSNPIYIATWYNITAETGRNNLIKSLVDVLKDQHELHDSIQSGKSKIYLLVPYYDILLSQCCIDESINEENAVSMLIYMKELFDDIKTLRLQEEKKDDISITCKIFQQLMMCRLSDRSYDIFFAEDHQYLKDKIAFAYFGAPVNTDGTYSTQQNKMINKAYKTIIYQNKNHAMDDGVVVISFVYVCCLNYKKQIFTETQQLVNIVNTVTFKPLPCFVLRKCYDDEKPSAHYCRTVIDNTLRVYQSWDEFLNNNTYPKCIICVPTNGRYQCDDNGDVLVEYYYSPSCSIPQKTLRAIDKTAAVAGIGSGGLLLLAAIPTLVIAPVAIVGALGISAGAGLYSIVRSIFRIVDKSIHDEDLSPTEPEARAAYIGIIAGSLGFAGAGANVIISKLASNGVQLGRGAILTVEAISKANLAAGGIALSNSVCDVAYSYLVQKVRPSPLVFVQLGASILFFTNAVYNYKETSEFIDNDKKKNAIQHYNNSLKTKKDSSQMGKFLSALKKTPNEDETVAMILKNQEQLSEVGVKYINGNINFNDEIMNIAAFTKFINTVDVGDITIPSNTSITNSSMNTLSDLNALAFNVIPAFSNSNDVEATVLNLLQLFAPVVQRKLLDLLDKIFTSDVCSTDYSVCEKLGNDLRTGLKKRGISLEIISQIINCLVSTAETYLNVDVGWFRRTGNGAIVMVNYFLSERSITPQLVQLCLNYLNSYVAKKVVKYIKGAEVEEKIQIIKKIKHKQCSKCNGYYHVNK